MTGTPWLTKPPGACQRRRRACYAAVGIVLVALVAMTGVAAVRHWGRASTFAFVGCRAEPSLVDVMTTFAYQPGDGNRATGIVLTAAGEVVTNNHVIAGAGTVTVRDLVDGRRYAATVVGSDVTDDVAVLRLEGADDLEAATLGLGTSIARGEQILAIGNGNGTCGSPTVTSGTIVGLGSMTVASDGPNDMSLPLTGMVQVTAPLEPGDSGGALVDHAGRVIGMLTAGYRDASGGYLGFAIPISRVVDIARQIVAGRASFTIHVGPTASLGAQFSCLDYPATDFLSGILITAVSAGSPAERGGLRSGDVVTWFARHRIQSPAQMTELLQRERPGDVVQVAWTDGVGATHQAAMTLVSGPPQ